MFENLKKYAFFVIIVIIIILFFLFTGDAEMVEDDELNAVNLAENSQQDENLLEPGLAASDNSVAFVDIKGAVLKPGVYEIEIDSRVNDAILKAGGFTADADQTGVNLAQKIQDEMVLVIPRIGEQPSSTNSTSSDLLKIRLNYATQEEIESLTGIGPSKAQAIIAHRDEHGFFQTVEDLLEVSGIGEKTLDNLKDSIQVP
ncbi:helix-hairpin-helix domain-containing protein [Oceanobacillus chungangensis]|uniref:Competence protein ComEA n=1 Tax=Oceanobacillus chungangensis TaxID=1229152 RepID=A0A3D8Q2A8_9BACI|nr:helix-hairpin-helix domain-containing protein [Oceanobacillus chungangensis]RDW21741.1 competence protein ComEA [Oceanobacillus chungangensis]